MKIRFSRTPTFTKGIIASAVFTIIYLASASSLPSCSDTAAVLSSGGCVERQSFLHTASGWLALISLIAAVLLLILKHKDSILVRLTPAQPAPAQQTAAQHAHQGPPAPAAGMTSDFCTKCGTRIITGDRFCQGCGASTGSL
jgi:zinc-ribbon domain